MSSPGTPLPSASFPIPPPVPALPVVDPHTGKFSAVGINFITQLWAAIQGSGGAIDQIALKLNKALAEGSIFTGQADGNASGVPLSGDASIVPDGEITVLRVRIEVTAGTDLSGHAAVCINAAGLAVYPSLATLSDGLGIVGITTGAIINGDIGPVQVAGSVVEPSWTWTPGLPVYAGDGGALTQTAPTGAWLLQIGIAETPKSMTITRLITFSTP